MTSENIETVVVKGKVYGKKVKYRLTNFNNQSFEVYNKTTGRIFGITASIYASIFNSKHRFEDCVLIEKEFFA